MSSVRTLGFICIVARVALFLVLKKRNRLELLLLFCGCAFQHLVPSWLATNSRGASSVIHDRRGEDALCEPRKKQNYTPGACRPAMILFSPTYWTPATIDSSPCRLKRFLHQGGFLTRNRRNFTIYIFVVVVYSGVPS